MNDLKSRGDWVGHVFAWLGGVLFALAPFVHVWEVAPEMPLRLGNAQFGFNLIIGVTLFFVGGIIGGYWWRFCRWMRGEGSVVLRSIAGVWLLFGLCSVLGLVSAWFCYLVFGLILCVGITYSFLFRVSGRFGLLKKVRKGDVWSWLKEGKRSNYLFFVLLVLVLSVNNTMALLKLDLSGAELTSAIVGRVFFSCFVVGCCYILSELSMRATPRKLRWTIWCVLALLPMVVLGDTLLNQLYGRSQLELFNSLTATGELDVMKELEGGGFGGVTVGMLVTMLVGVFVVSVGVTYGLWRLSCRWGKRVSLCFGVVFAVGCYLLCVGEQFVGKQWKELPSWRQEYKSFMLHQGVVAPQLGLADFVVEFRGHDPCAVPLSDDEVSRIQEAGLPDIYMIMVETMRYDAMDAKTTPFLMEFKKDCQQLGETWSGSNATHLSWYSLFYSKPAVSWLEDLEAIPDRGSYGGSPVLKMMKSVGYNFEIRAVCDLGYKDFGLLNFGEEEGKLFSVLEDASEGSDLNEFGLIEREKISFKKTLESANSKKSAGGNFYYVALDSPHYNYYWDSEFEVPYDEYKEDISFPLFPSRKEVELYHNRYLNSVAWVDHQLKEFCDVLKAEGQYENSIIIVTGDHGEEFQEEGGWCHCTSLMKEQTQVPILVKWPSGGSVLPRQRQASHADIWPSVFSYLGFPEEQIDTMTGDNLLEDDGDKTLLVATAYANKTGETMMLKRAGYTAYFSWSRPWEPRVPDEMRLERIVDPRGKLVEKKGMDYAAKLKELFPDAFEKYFVSLRVAD